MTNIAALKFRAQIPPELLHGLKPHEKWMYEQMDIQRQQNEFIIERLAEGEEQMRSTDAEVSALAVKVKEFENLRLIITSKWSVFAAFMVLIGIPVLLIFAGAWIQKWFTK